MRASLALLVPCLALAGSLSGLLSSGCDADATGAPESGTVNLGPDDGVDFQTGRKKTPGNYANADLVATANGDSGMRLASGGSSPTTSRPLLWFKNAGGLPQQFTDLASVPSSPEPTGSDVILNAKAGYGFLVEAKNGDLVRAWISAASAEDLTLQWARVVPGM